jgi:hypothetical protein
VPCITASLLFHVKSIRVSLKELPDAAMIYEGKIHLQELKTFLKFHICRLIVYVAERLQAKNLNIK